MLNSSYCYFNNFCAFSVFVIVDMKTACPSVYVGTFMIYNYPRFHISDLLTLLIHYGHQTERYKNSNGYALFIPHRYKNCHSKNCIFSKKTPGKGRGFSPLHSVQTGCGDHPASSPIGIGDSFPQGIAAGT